MILSRYRSARRTALALSLLCAALGVVIYIELTDDPTAAAPASMPGGNTPLRPAAADVPTFTMAPQSSFAEILDRPLFSATRRPPAAAEADRVVPQSDFVLVGVITSSQERVALIQHGKQVERLAEGDATGGWTVKSIERDRVLLQSPDRRLELTVNDRELLASHPQRGNRVQPSSTNLSSVPARGAGAE